MASPAVQLDSFARAASRSRRNVAGSLLDLDGRDVRVESLLLMRGRCEPSWREAFRDQALLRARGDARDERWLRDDQIVLHSFREMRRRRVQSSAREAIASRVRAEASKTQLFFCAMMRNEMPEEKVYAKLSRSASARNELQRELC